MGLFDQFPYTNFHELNLDWILTQLINLYTKLDNFVALNTIKYANPIQWNIATQYPMNTVVVDPITGNAYLSVQPVPTGVPLSNADYWTLIFNLNLLSANQNITLRDDGANILASFESDTGEWLIWNGVLYKASQHINVNEAYVVGYNLDRYTVEQFIKDYIQNTIDYIDNLVGDLDNLTTTDKSNIVAAINEIDSTLVNTIGALADLDTTDKSNIVAAINENVGRLDALDLGVYYANIKNYGAVGDGVTDDRQAFVDALATGKIVVVPEGTYRVSSQITVDAGTSIIGVGKGKSIIKFDEQTTTQKYIFANYTATAKKGFLMRDLTLDVNTYLQDPRKFNGGVFLQAFTDILIDNIEVLNTSEGGNGVTLWGCSRGTVSNCYMHKLYGSGIYVCNTSADISIVDNVVKDCLVTSGCIDIFDSVRITAKGNKVSSDNSTTFGFNLDTIRECVISGNTCDDSNCGIAAFVIYECIISDNTCRNNTFAGIELQIGIDGVSTSPNNTITNNFIAYSGQFGIVDSSNGNYNKFIGNHIEESNRHGLYVVGTHASITINDNTIYDSSLDADGAYCDIFIGGNVQYTSICNNMITSPKAGNNIFTNTNTGGHMICNNTCISVYGTYNIRNGGSVGQIIDNNRGTVAP